MKIRSLGYCATSGIKNIFRNRIFSLASIATMSLCIFILGMFYSITTNLNYMVDKMSGSLCVKAFFVEGISEERIKSIGNTLGEYPEVTTVHYTSADEAWEKYKEIYFGEKYAELADGYADDNPLANSASYEIYFSDSQLQEELVRKIEAIDGIRRVDSSQVTADSLTEIRSLVQIISVVVMGILLFIALFLINNTIAVGITVRANEISIMRLLGARNGFIRAPFLVEGMVLGLVGTIIPLVVVYIVYDKAVVYIMSRFSFIANVLAFMPVTELYKTFLPIAVILGIGLGLIGSMTSVTKHLKA